MLTSRYMTSVKNLPAIMQKIVEGTAPEKFTIAHLKSIGFKSSNDQGILPLLKDLGFLSADGTPTQRYHDYRDRSQSKTVMADALREGYEELFHINEKPTESDRDAIHGKFKSAHNVTDRVAQEQTRTFLALLKLADLDTKKKSKKAVTRAEERPPNAGGDGAETKRRTEGHIDVVGLRYNVEIHLPATKDVEVYNAIFRSLKEHLIED